MIDYTLPRVVHEESIADPAPSDVPEGPFRMSYEKISTGTQRGKDELIDTYGFTTSHTV